MKRCEHSTTILIGGCRRADRLRRALSRRSEVACGIGTHLRGLRQSLLIDPAPVTVLCVSLDRATLKRYGKPLRSLLEDRRMFGGAVRVLGLLPEDRQSDAWELNCDVYVDSPDAAMRVMDLLAADAARPGRSYSATDRFTALNGGNERARRLRSPAQGRTSRRTRWNIGGEDNTRLC